MGSEDNKLTEEYLATARARKCILISFSHQLYSVLQMELHSMEEYNPVLLLLPSGDRERSSALLSMPLSGTQSIQRQKLKFVLQNMRNSVKQCTGMNVWSSSRLSMSPTQRLSAPQS